MDGRSGAAGTGGKRRAAGRNRGLARRRGRGLQGRTDGRACTSKAEKTDGSRVGRRQTVKPRAQIEPQSRYASLSLPSPFFTSRILPFFPPFLTDTQTDHVTTLRQDVCSNRPYLCYASMRPNIDQDHDIYF